MSAEFESRRQRRQAEAVPPAPTEAPTFVSSFAPTFDSPPAPTDYQNRPSALEALLARNGASPVQPTPEVPVLPSVQDRVDQLLRASNQGSQPAALPPVGSAAVAPVAEPAAALSRREMRQQQAAQVAPPAYVPSPSAYAPPVAPYQAPVAPYAPPVVSNQAPVAQYQQPVNPAPASQAPVPPAAPAPSPSRRDRRDRVREPAADAEFAVRSYESPYSDPSSTSMFETSSGFSLDTTTNSIVLPMMPDALSATLITDSGVTIKTGSIELPNLNSGTGSIALPAAAQLADDAQRLDSQTSFVSSISPVAAKNLLKHNPRLGFAPVKTRGTQGQLFYALTTSFLMLTVGGLMLVAWMYGFIK